MRSLSVSSCRSAPRIESRWVIRAVVARRRCAIGTRTAVLRIFFGFFLAILGALGLLGLRVLILCFLQIAIRRFGFAARTFVAVFLLILCKLRVLGIRAFGVLSLFADVR